MTDPLLAAPALFVPVSVEALAVTDDSAARVWSWGRPAYGQLRRLRHVDPLPFNSEFVSVPGQPQFRGVILHWALPQALAAGAQGGAAEVRYRAVPNRWLVVRKHPAAGAWAHRAWVVASDVSPSPDGRGSPWPTPDGRQTTIGATWPVEQWPGEAVLAAPQDGPLTAVGPGDAAFAAFTPENLGVLSFADALATPAVAGPLSYTVLGWYADAAHDPLLGAAEYGPDGWHSEQQWRDLMARLRLTVGDEARLTEAEAAARAWAQAHGRVVDGSARTRLPARILCHGGVQGVPWTGPAGPTASGVPTVNAQLPSYVRPRVAVAHNAADALAALYGQVRTDQGVPPDVVAQLTDVFTAFAHDLLPLLAEGDGLERLAAAVQQGWFGAAEGGTAWQVVARPDADAPRGEPGQPPLTARQRELLDVLIRAQERADAQTRLAGAEQWSLYGLWWKRTRLADELPPPPAKLVEQVDNAFNALAAALPGVIDRVHAALRERDAAEVALREELADADLVPGAADPFFAPTDPVVLVSGVRRTRRDVRAAGGEELLACRFTGQAVYGIDVAVPGGHAPVTARDVPPPHWRPDALPPETPDLLAESFFLDLDDAPAIAAVAAAEAGVPDPWTLLPTIRTEQSVIWNAALHPGLTDPAALADDSSLIFQYALGALPLSLAVAFHRPPWSPLYLDWTFVLYPGSRSQATALTPWRLPPDGARERPLDAFTYRWQPPGPPPRTGPVALSGRSLLTPQATDTLAARLAALLRDFPDAPEVRDNLAALQDALDYAGAADLLSQSATGLGLALLERSPAAFLTPPDGSLDPYLRPPGGPDLVPDSTPQPRLGATQPFHGLRAGHLHLTRLWVVDDFGQVFKVIDPAGAALPTSARPALPADLRTAEDPVLIELKPRITQFARLGVDLLPGAVPADPDNPVLGWLAHNRIDRALLVYGAGGAFEGALLEGVDRALWSPDPERWRPAAAAPDPSDIADPHLRALVLGLFDRPDSAAALRELRALIDEAAWSREPRDGFAAELPLLTGRPLAVVRARLRLAPRGLPAVNQAWDLTGQNVTDGFDRIALPVQLGTGELLDDGVAGYYLDGDYTTVNTEHAVPDGAYVAHRRPHVSLDGAHAPIATLLLDPAGAVHAISGILPIERREIPGRFVVPALARLAVSLRIGPLLGAPGAAAMPLPTLSKGTWSWLSYRSPEHTAQAAPAERGTAAPALSDGYPLVREGWLRLDPDGVDSALTAFATPATLPVTQDPADRSTAALRITVHNDTGHAVDCAAITLSAPIGPGPADLTPDAETLQPTAEPADRWAVRTDGPGRFTLLPAALHPHGRVEAGAAVVLQAAGIRVGAQAGRAILQVTVHTREGSHSEQRVEVAVDKALQRPATLLAYSVRPAAIRAGAPARLRIGCFNGSGAPVACSRIVLSLPAGSGPGDLTARPDLVVASTEDPAWSVSGDGVDGFVLVPALGEPVVLPPGGRLNVALNAVHAADAPGLALIGVAETAGARTAAGPFAAPAARRGSADVEKTANL